MRKILIFFRHYGLLIIAIFSFALSLFAVGYLITTFSETGNINETSVGVIYLGNKNEDEYHIALIQGVNDWKTIASYEIQFQDYIFEVDLTLFDFDVESTISNMIQNQSNNAVFFISDENKNVLLTELDAVYGSTIAGSINTDQLITDIILDINNLYYLRTYEVINYLDSELAMNVIDTFDMTNISSKDVTQIMYEYFPITIKAEDRFSLLDTFLLSGLSNEQLSIIASGIEKLILNTSFYGITKYHYQVAPSWAELGCNVRILKVNQFDFQFFNNQNFDYTVTISKIDNNSLQFSLLGYPSVSSYQVNINDSISIPFETISVDDESINALTPNVIIEETDTEIIYTVIDQVGVNGKQVLFSRTTTYQDSSQKTLYLMNENTSPVSQIIRQNIIVKGE
ncbi:MAG: hypothetical protein PHC62_05675 [Candidatus Izemoplasmatales bacterium]|nr:hypothetical protein [Candidatus Izemoplasmatales bacterium]